MNKKEEFRKMFLTKFNPFKQSKINYYIFYVLQSISIHKLVRKYKITVLWLKRNLIFIKT